MDPTTAIPDGGLTRERAARNFAALRKAVASNTQTTGGILQFLVPVSKPDQYRDGDATAIAYWLGVATDVRFECQRSKGELAFEAHLSAYVTHLPRPARAALLPSLIARLKPRIALFLARGFDVVEQDFPTITAREKPAATTDFEKQRAARRARKLIQDAGVPDIPFQLEQLPNPGKVATHAVVFRTADPNGGQGVEGRTLHELATALTDLLDDGTLRSPAFAHFFEADNNSLSVDRAVNNATVVGEARLAGIRCTGRYETLRGVMATLRGHRFNAPDPALRPTLQ